MCLGMKPYNADSWHVENSFSNMIRKRKNEDDSLLYPPPPVTIPTFVAAFSLVLLITSDRIITLSPHVPLPVQKVLQTVYGPKSRSKRIYTIRKRICRRLCRTPLRCFPEAVPRGGFSRASMTDWRHYPAPRGFKAWLKAVVISFVKAAASCCCY